MIPKIIHYCWYGKNKKSPIIKKCINSWKEYFPDFEIIEWNEGNTNLDECSYIKKAYREKKWAFVSDYVRMKVLYEQGGMYFDTDVEVLRRFPDELFELDSFSGIEEFSKLVSPGLVLACNSGNRIIKELLDEYKSSDFVNERIDDIKTVNLRMTENLEKKGYKRENTKQMISGMTIFPSSVFCGYDAEKRAIKIEADTLSVHHYSHSWFPWYRKIRMFLGTAYRRMKYRWKKCS